MLFKDNQAIFMQIAELACEKILLGIWPPGERIPSVRDLGVTLQVNPNTVVRSYEFLEQRNIIVNKRGIGYFAEQDAPDKIRAYRRTEFLTNDLPAFLRNLYLLDISMDEINAVYKVFLQNQQP